MVRDKKLIRAEMLEKRRQLSEAVAVDKGNILAEKLLKLENIEKANTIMCYLNYDKELSTLGFVQRILSLGKRVAVPYIMSRPEEGAKMSAALLSSFSKLKPNRLGILEPDKLTMQIIEPGEIDVVIVPGLAFDISGNRLGFGGGYYDRFLKQVGPECAKIAVCYDFQIIDEVPVEPHDFKMDMIISV